MQFRAALRLRRSADQPRTRVVVDVSRARAHHRLKHLVDGRKDGFGRTEVFRQIDSRARLAGECAEFFEEQPRLCLPEAIDRLLDVAHEKEIVPARDAGENRLLHAVAVLIFVHGNPAKLFAIFLRDLVFAQREQGEMLQIVIIDKILFPFGLGIALLKPRGKGAKRGNHRTGAAKHGQFLRLTAQKAFFLLFDEVFAHVPRGLCARLVLLGYRARKDEPSVFHRG